MVGCEAAFSSLDAHEARLAMAIVTVSSQGFNVWCVMLSLPVFDFFSISMDKVSLGLSPIVVQYRKNIRKKNYLTSSKCFSLSAAILSAITYICWNVKQRKDK